MSCATELLHAANFCPVCGARLAAPTSDGSAATMPGGTTPDVVVVPPDAPIQNVVYLTEQHGILPGPPRGAVPPNPHAHEYEGAAMPIDPPEAAGPAVLPARPRGAEPVVSELEALRARAADLEATLAAVAGPSGSHGPVPSPGELVPPRQVNDNPFGDFFSDGPSAWLEDDPDDVEVTQPRVVGTMLAAGAICMLIAAWVVWGLAIYRGAGGAEAGGFVLLAMLLWIWYLSMPRAQQHTFLLRRHASMQGLVDRRITPIRNRTEGQFVMRRERDRYRAMRDERSRRISALGEGAYRSFRHGTLPAELESGAQRVLAIERQMLAQDQRIHALGEERTSTNGGRSRRRRRGSDTAADTPDDGHSPS